MPFVVRSSAPWTFVVFSIQTRKRQAAPEINRLLLSCLLRSLALQLQSAKSSFGNPKGHPGKGRKRRERSLGAILPRSDLNVSPLLPDAGSDAADA